MAKRKEVLLVKDVLKLGNMGDVVRVSPGFARNYLYPFGMAVPAEGAAKRQIEVLRDKAAKSEADREQKATALRKTMEGMTVQVAARVAHELELFGSIGTREIVAALAKKGIELDGKQVHLHDKIRRLGVYSVEIRLHKNVPTTVKLEVINSDPNAPSLQDTLAQVAADRIAQAQKTADARAAEKAAKEKGKEGAADGATAEAAPQDAEKPAGTADEKGESKSKSKSKGESKSKGDAGEHGGKDATKGKDGSKRKDQDDGKSGKKNAKSEATAKKTAKV